MSKLMGMSLITLWVMGASLIDSFVSDDWWHTYKGFRVLTATHSFSCSKTINRFDVSGCMQFVITLLVHKLLFFSSESQDVKGSRYSFPALPELVLIALQICTRPSHLFSCWCCSSQNMSKQTCASVVVSWFVGNWGNWVCSRYSWIIGVGNFPHE